jgi:ABC-type branched-subunit amino acid transport system permease subunit
VARRSRPPSSGRRWVAVCTLALVLIALIVALIYPTFRRQGQYATLRAHGVTGTARISYCINTGGSNSTFAGETTCKATFVLDGSRLSEDLLGVHSQFQTGTRVRVLVDPRNPQDVYPVSDVRTGYRTGWLTHDTFVAVLAAVLLVLTVASQVIVVRRRRWRLARPVSPAY